jgi:hypothetical protein
MRRTVFISLILLLIAATAARDATAAPGWVRSGQPSVSTV